MLHQDATSRCRVGADGEKGRERERQRAREGRRPNRKRDKERETQRERERVSQKGATARARGARAEGCAVLGFRASAVIK